MIAIVVLTNLAQPNKTQPSQQFPGIQTNNPLINRAPNNFSTRLIKPQNHCTQNTKKLQKPNSFEWHKPNQKIPN